MFRIIISLWLISLMPSQALANDWLKQAEGILGQVGAQLPKTSAGSSTGLSNKDMINGLKDALSVGTGRVVNRLSLKNAFNSDSLIHIPLPKKMEQARSMLARFGMSASLDDLELKVNRAAEKATPKAKKLFMQSIRNMSLRDAQGILQGPDDAATRYFERTMSPDLRKTIRPLIAKMLNQVGAVRSYDNLMNDYRNLPMVPDLKADLNTHAMDGTLRGIFHYLAKEEADIRHNPAKRTTSILRKVFSR